MDKRNPVYNTTQFRCGWTQNEPFEHVKRDITRHRGPFKTRTIENTNQIYFSCIFMHDDVLSCVEPYMYMDKYD